MALARPRRTPPPPSGEDLPVEESLAEELPPEEPLPEEPPAPMPPPPPPVPPGIKVRISGKDYEVAPDVAQAMSDREREFNQRFSEQGRELGEWRAGRRTTAPAPAPAPAPAAYDWNTAIFERPEEALQRLKAEAVNEAEARLTRRYTADQQQREFWAKFYTDHDDLKDDQFMVNAMASEMDREGWADQPATRIHEFAEELASRTRQQLLRLARRHGAGDSATPETVPQTAGHVERGARARPAARPPAAPPAPVTIVGLLQQRRERRQRAGQEET